METVNEIIRTIEPIFKNLYVQIGLLIVFATVHGYIGAWLAVRMLFRPRHPFKVLGITLFPQGMIPRHRDRLATAIGKAVGEELVSQETIMEELLGKDFLRRKIRGVVDSYTGELMSQSYPSLIEALPAKLRAPVLDAITSLQLKVAKHIEDVLKSEESIETIRGFVERRVDDFLSKRVSEIVDDEAFEKIVGFLEDRIRTAIASPPFIEKIKDFISRRVDDLANTETPLGQMFTEDSVLLLKEKAGEQIEPVIHRLTELAAAEKTRNQIGALIKQEVHGYYEQLPFFKKIFVSRENLIGEVDDLVNDSLPKRIEETLKGDFFADEARNFIDSSIDNALARPLPEIVGTIAPQQLERLKAQIAKSVFARAGRGNDAFRVGLSYRYAAKAAAAQHRRDYGDAAHRFRGKAQEYAFKSSSEHSHAPGNDADHQFRAGETGRKSPGRAHRQALRQHLRRKAAYRKRIIFGYDNRRPSRKAARCDQGIRHRQCGA